MVDDEELLELVEMELEIFTFYDYDGDNHHYSRFCIRCFKW